MVYNLIVTWTAFAILAMFLHYKIKQKTSQNRAKIPLILTSEGLKYPSEVRVQHETFSTICGTHVQAILKQKNVTCLAGGDQGRSKKVKILPRMDLAFGLGALSRPQMDQGTRLKSIRGQLGGSFGVHFRGP